MSQRLLLLLCVSVPSFMINLDGNIVAVSLTSIAHSLHADFAAIEWVISAYTLTFATLLMPAGALADRFGRKRMLVLGLAVFTVASGLCGSAATPAWLNWSRALQGAGAAMQLSSALAILSHGFQGRARAQAFAFWGSVIGVGVMLGPVAGGLITQYLGWQWAFYVNLPVGIVMIAMTLVCVSESSDPNALRVDVAGVLSFSGFLALLTLALISGNHQGWSSRPVTLELAAAAALALLFVAVEARQSRPMVDLAYFRRPTYLGANLAGVVYAMAYLTMLTYLPFYFQGALGFAPLKAGLSMLPLALPMFVVPRLVSLYLDHRWSGRALLVLGLALVTLGLALSAARIAQLQYLGIVWSMFIASMGAGILNGQIARVGMTVIPVERAGMASGVAGTMRFSGIVVGFAGLGAVLFQRVGASLGQALPGISSGDLLDLTRTIANGNVHAAGEMLQTHPGAAELARDSLGYGYQGVLTVAALVAGVATILCWWLISPAETAPHGIGTADSVNEVLID